MGNCNARTMVFTITDNEAKKPIVWAQSADSTWLDDHDKVKDAAIEWFNSNAPEVVTTDGMLDDLSYAVRRESCFWLNERYCFELSPVYG